MSDSSPTRTRFCRPVSSGSSVASCAATPMWRRTSPGCFTTSIPATVARPASGRASVVRIRTAVVLPAPFGPEQPEDGPGGHGQVHPGQGLGLAVPLRQALGLDHQFGLVGHRCVLTGRLVGFLAYRYGKQLTYLSSSRMHPKRPRCRQRGAAAARLSQHSPNARERKRHDTDRGQDGLAAGPRAHRRPRARRAPERPLDHDQRPGAGSGRRR